MACEDCACGASVALPPRRGAAAATSADGGAGGGGQESSTRSTPTDAAAANAAPRTLWPTTTTKKRGGAGDGTTTTPSYGSVSAAGGDDVGVAPPPNTARECDKHRGLRRVCCRDIQALDEEEDDDDEEDGEDGDAQDVEQGGAGGPDGKRAKRRRRRRRRAQHTLIDPDVVRDCIIGLSDGLTVPFALTAGLSGVGSSRLVVVAGLAELVSGAISMGVGGLLSAQAEVAHYRAQSSRLQRRLELSCGPEVRREIAKLLEPFGVDEELAANLAQRLQSVEQAERDTPTTRQRRPRDEVSDADEAVVDGERSALLPSTASRSHKADDGDDDNDDKEVPERGLTPFLLKLQGHEAVASSRIWQSALVIGASYFLGGLVPLLPYVFVARVSDALLVSSLVTALVLLAFGACKQRWTGASDEAGWKGGLAYGAVSTLFIGAAAAACSWGIVYALEGRGGGGGGGGGDGGASAARHTLAWLRAI